MDKSKRQSKSSEREAFCFPVKLKSFSLRSTSGLCGSGPRVPKRGRVKETILNNRRWQFGEAGGRRTERLFELSGHVIDREVSEGMET